MKCVELVKKRYESCRWLGLNNVTWLEAQYGRLVEESACSLGVGTTLTDSALVNPKQAKYPPSLPRLEPACSSHLISND
jgi:hypothetical protein